MFGEHSNERTARGWDACGRALNFSLNIHSLDFFANFSSWKKEERLFEMQLLPITLSFQIAAFAAKKSFLQANEVKITRNFYLIRLLGFPFALAKSFSGTSHENLVSNQKYFALTWQKLFRSVMWHWRF
jgi:hypothetical protein